MTNRDITHARIPMKNVGPMRLSGPLVDAEVMVPLATYESPLWPSVERGARVTAHAGGIRTVLLDDRMSRSVLFDLSSAEQAKIFVDFVYSKREDLKTVAAGTSRFARLLDIHTEVVGPLVWIRFELTTGDASGHNMVTRASEALQTWLLEHYPAAAYISISGNYCCDKKNSAVNGILGRGKSVVAEATIPRRLVERFLHTPPEKIVELNWRKNWMGSGIAGSVRSANAHFANMLLAFYLATGQDAANIVEASQGFVYAETRGDDLYFSCTLPNLILGTAGNGKDLPFVQDNLNALGCVDEREPGDNARRLAAICAAAVLCGELSLLAAQTNPGELMAAHIRLERGNNKNEVDPA